MSVRDLRAYCWDGVRGKRRFMICHAEFHAAYEIRMARFTGAPMARVRVRLIPYDSRSGQALRERFGAKSFPVVWWRP